MKWLEAIAPQIEAGTQPILITNSEFRTFNGIDYAPRSGLIGHDSSGYSVTNACTEQSLECLTESEVASAFQILDVADSDWS